MVGIKHVPFQRQGMGQLIVAALFWFDAEGGETMATI
jgi:hypothetical protein